MLEKLAADSGGRWELVKVNLDEHPGLAEIYGVRGIPDVKLFRDGLPAASFAGAFPEGAVRHWLEQQLAANSQKTAGSSFTHPSAGGGRANIT